MTDSSLSKDEFAWCAGVIDALGLIKTRPMQTGSELAYVAISSSRVDILTRLSELTGVAMVTVNRNYNRLGCDVHCVEAHVHVQSSTGRWSLTGVKAAIFLAAIQPYVQMKKDEVGLALGAAAGAPRKQATVEKMKQLGWPTEEWE